MIYKIKTGEHSSGLHIPKLTFSTKVKFLFRLKKDAEYMTKTFDNQTDINKIYGFSDCWDHHKVNSIRLGWNFDLIEGKIKLYAYCHVNRAIRIWYITEGLIDSIQMCTIQISKSDRTKYLIEVDGVSIAVPRANKSRFALRYKLFPYFGGTEPAPQDITVEVQEI